MRILTVCFLTLLIAPVFIVPAFAQTAAPTTTQQPTANSVAPPVANTATALTAQQAATMYQSCLAQGAPAELTPQTKDIFCQCTATYTQKAITVEEMAAATTAGNPNAAAIQQKIILEVYAPCMEFPVRDLITAECVKTPALAANPQICPCLAKNMSAYTAQTAQANLGKLMASGRPVGDVMNGLMETPEFKAAQQDIAMKCMTGALQ
jgi:hypothetical protein